MTSFGRVLIVDDDADMVAVLDSVLTADGFRVDACHDISSMKHRVRQFSYDAILLDLFLGEDSSVEALPYLARECPFAVVIVMTAHASVELAVEAMERGATGFLTKGDDPNKIAAELKRRLAKKSVSLANEGTMSFEKFGIIGQSDALLKVLDQVQRLKDTDATVLIQGESGTGKELIARAIHQLSPRRSHPFEALNCAAIPENLLESELFGYKRGAFTDAKSDHRGMFEICSNGTLFLDEIGDMPFPLQVKLLRVLQEREVTPLGAGRSIPIRTRVLAASNRDLEEEVSRGRFREDLFFRLNIISLYLPPLRERTSDLGILVQAFIDKFNQRYQKSIQKPGRDFLARLEAYPWPGNIRELQNAIERAIVLTPDDQLHIEDVLTRKLQKNQGESALDGAFGLSYAEAKEAFEKNFLIRILTAAKGSIAEAARLSGRYRSDIYRLLERYHLNIDDYRES